MWKRCCLLLYAIASAYGSGELSILEAPDALEFLGQEQLYLSSVKDVLTTTLGFSIPESKQAWSGLVIRSPFQFTDALVVVSVPGVASLDSVQGRTYPLVTDEPIEDTWLTLRSRMEEHYPLHPDNLTLNHLVVDSWTDAKKLYGDLSKVDLPSVEYLKPTSVEDENFLKQVNLLDSITTQVADKGVKSDGVPDLHWFTVPGLHNLIDTYGSTSKQVQEAKRLLSSSILLLSEVFNTAYDDKVVFAVVSSDVVHTRRYRRETSNETGNGNLTNKKLGETLQDDDTADDLYPIMFNIFLWFGIAFIMVLLATSLGIANMDPGRDSIIYRMTSNRMKKDN